MDAQLFYQINEWAGGDPNSVNWQPSTPATPPAAAQQNYYDPNATAPQWSPNVVDTQSSSVGNIPGSQQDGYYPAQAPTTSGGDPAQAQWEALMNQYQAQQRAIGVQQATLALQPQVQAAGRAVIGASEQEIAAKARVLDMTPEYIQAGKELQTAKRGLLAGEKQELSVRQRIMQEQLEEELAIQAAQQDTGDILRVALTQRRRDALNYRFAIAGLPNPIEVDLPPDYEGPMPPGIVKRLKTLAEILSDAAKNKNKLRQFEIEAAQIKTAILRTKVTAAEIRQGDIRLTLDEANLAADRAGLLVASARLDQDRVNLLIQQAKAFEAQANIDFELAQLATARTKLPPAPGLVWDETGGEWVSRAELELRETSRKPISQSELTSLVLTGTITPEEMGRRLAAEGYLPETVRLFVEHARRLKEERDKESGGGLGSGPPGRTGPIQAPDGSSAGPPATSPSFVTPAGDWWR